MYTYVNVRFKTQDLFGQGSNGSFARNTGSSYRDLISSRSGAADAVNNAGSYFVLDATTESRFDLEATINNNS